MSTGEPGLQNRLPMITDRIEELMFRIGPVLDCLPNVVLPINSWVANPSRLSDIFAVWH